MSIEHIFNSMGYAARHGKLGTVIKNLVSSVQEIETDLASTELLLNKIKAVTNVTVTFDSDGGSDVDSQIIAFGTKATSPTAPTKEDYTFVGWFTEDDEFDFNTLIEANITLTAHWTEDENEEETETE